MRQDVGAWTGTGGQADAVSNWAKMRVVEVRQPRNYQYEGLTVAETLRLAAEKVIPFV